MASNHKPTRQERREQKKRKRMTVTGKHVFALKQLMARQKTKSQKAQYGPGRRGNQGLTSIRGSHRIHKPSKINKWT